MYLHFPSRQGLLFLYDFCKRTFCQVFALEKTGKGESTSCIACCGHEVSEGLWFPRGFVPGRADSSLHRVHVTSNFALLGKWCQSQAAPATGREGKRSRDGKLTKAGHRGLAWLALLLPGEGEERTTTAGFGLTPLAVTPVSHGSGTGGNKQCGHSRFAADRNLPP